MSSADYKIALPLASDPRESALDTWQLRTVLVVIVCFAIMIPILLWGIPSNLDLTNHFRFALPFYDSIVAGDFYPGWLAESNSGYGDPSFRFYPPGLYYLLAASRLVIGNWYGATIVTFVILSIVSGLGMYFWARSFMTPATASWAGFFYALAPYHVTQLYQAAMLAEWAASSVLPFVFGFVDRVCERGKPRDVAGLAFTYGLLIFTHLPLAVIGSLALLVYALVRMEGPGKFLKLVKLSCGTILGLALSAIYWVTMVSEVGWISKGDSSPFSYSREFLLITLSPENLNVWWMNILTLMTLLLCAPVILFLFRAAAPSRRTVRPVIILTAFALFMALPLSWPVWYVLRPLQEVQFPWRWLAVFSMGASLVTAAALPFVMDAAIKLDRAKRLLVFGTMLISVAFTFSHSVREAQYFSRTRFEGMVMDVRGTPALSYWLPVGAKYNPREMSNVVEVADREVTIANWRAEHRTFSVAAGTAAEARIKTYYYPHWTAKNETGILPTHPDKDGALLISLPSKATSVELDFREPARTKFSTTASLSGLIIMGILMMPFRWRRKP